MMRKWLLMGLIMALAWIPASAEAHKPSDSYLTLTFSGAAIEGRWDIALRDLDYAIGIDGNDDGAITWGELRGRHEAIAAYALSRLQIRAGGAACPTRPLKHLVENHSDGAYAVLRFAIDCQNTGRSLDIAYNLFFDLDPQHRGLLRIDSPDGTHTAIFSPERRLQRIELGFSNPWRQFLDYGRLGVWHIWIGFDHILFLVTLLLPAVLRRESGRWEAVANFRDSFLDVLRIVTSFTAAHSVTLSLATLGVISLPSRLIESGIAVSVVFAALNNVYPLVTRRLWLVAFAFGFIHGLGFATVLQALGLPQGVLLLALFGFNLGVEAGQLAIVAIVLPLAHGLRSWKYYPRAVLTFGSVAIAAIASLWFVERAFNVAPLIP